MYIFCRILCSQDKEVPHVRTGDDRHTGLPRPLPRLRRPPGSLRRPIGDPRTCAARRGNAVHGGVSAASRGGTLLHAQAGCNPPLGSAVTGTPSIPVACRGAATALSGVASADGAISHTQAAPPILPKIRSPQAASGGSCRLCSNMVIYVFQITKIEHSLISAGTYIWYDGAELHTNPRSYALR